MSIYNDKVLACLVAVALGRHVDRVHARVVHGLQGEVLEIGFGRNVPHLPSGVTRLLAVDPAVAAQGLAAGRIAARGLPVEHVGLDGAYLMLPDSSVDHVLSTWTLCTIVDVNAALAEVHRVLRPGGTLHFIRARPFAAQCRQQVAGPSHARVGQSGGSGPSLRPGRSNRSRGNTPIASR